MGMPAETHKPLRIYVAGPLAAPSLSGVEANVKAAMDAGIALLDMGHYPFIPHLNHWLERYLLQQDHLPLRRGHYMAWDKAFLVACDALYYMGSSLGADQELEWAEEREMPVYRTLIQVPRICRVLWERREI